MDSATRSDCVGLIIAAVIALDPELVALCLSFGLVSAADDCFDSNGHPVSVLQQAMTLGVGCFASEDYEEAYIEVLKAVVSATPSAALNRASVLPNDKADPVTPLFFACCNELASSAMREAVVRVLLDHGASAKQPGLLSIAVCQTVGVLKLLLDAGADASHCHEIGGSPLHAVAWLGVNNATDKVPLLTGAGAAVNAVDAYGATALQQAFASITPSQEVITALLAAGADTSALGNRMRLASSSDWTYTMHILAASGHPASMQRLLDPAVIPDGIIDVNARNFQGFTALHLTASLNRADVCSVLLAAGADMKVRDRNTDFPLSTAVKYGSYKVARVLANAGALALLSKRDLAGLIASVQERRLDSKKAAIAVIKKQKWDFGCISDCTADDIEKGWTKLLAMLQEASTIE